MNAARANASVVALAALLLAGCGEGMRSLPLSSAQNGGEANVTPSGRTSVTFSVKLPHAGAPASLALTIDRGTPEQQNATLSLAVGAPGCTNATRAAPPSCAVVLDLAPGAHVFDLVPNDLVPIAANEPRDDAAPEFVAPGSAIVSGFPFAVTAGSVNAVRLALEGVPAGIAALPAPNEDVQGTQSAGFELYGFYKADGVTKFDRTFFVAATDADGAYIVGAGAPHLEFVSADPEQWSDGVAAAGRPHAFVVRALDYAEAQPVRFTLTATTPGGAAVTAKLDVHVAARNAPRVYVASHLGGRPCAGASESGSISVFDEQGNPIDVPGAFRGLCGATGLAYVPRLDRIYAAQEFGDAILAFDLDGNRVETPGGFPNLSSPSGLAYDAAHDRLLAGNLEAPLTAYDVDGNVLETAGSWNEREGVAPNLPYGIVADPRGARVYVADAAYNRVEVYDAGGNALDAWTVPIGATGIARDAASGNLYVTDDDHGVHVFTRHGAAVPQTCRTGNYGCADGRPWSGARTPLGIAQSPGNGWFYVANYATNAITVYDKNGSQIAVGGTGFRPAPAGTTNGPIGIAIVP